MDLSADQALALREGSRAKLEDMRRALRSYSSAIVAFSGGVDSAFVLKCALEEVPRVIALTAISDSVPLSERQSTRDLAASLQADHLEVNSHEISNPQYTRNGTDRCYFCKTELYDLCEAKRAELGVDVVFDGFNADDTSDHRPGHKAAQEHRVFSPLANAGLTKAEIRAWSLEVGLPTWNKPAMPCLASRIPYGTSVTRERLFQVGAAEAGLRALGLHEFRVRHHDAIARVEVAAEELPKFADAQFAARALAVVKSQGFTFVTLDLEPFRSGRLNEAAGIASRHSAAKSTQSLSEGS